MSARDVIASKLPMPGFRDAWAREILDALDDAGYALVVRDGLVNLLDMALYALRSSEADAPATEMEIEYALARIIEREAPQ